MRKDLLTVVSWNIERGGLDYPENTSRWFRAIEAFRGPLPRPDILCVQEARDPHRSPGSGLLAQMAARLRLQPFAAPARAESGNASVVMVDPVLVEYAEPRVITEGMWRPTSAPVIQLKGLDRPFSVASVHLRHDDPAFRASEARRLTTLADHDQSAIVCGDFNSYRHRMPRSELPNWADISDPVHMRHRAVYTPASGLWEPDGEPDRILSAVGPNGRAPFLDLGWHAATELGEEVGLTPTATLWRDDQGEPQSVDRGYATEDLAQALVGYEVAITEETRAISDHAPVVMIFDLATLRQRLKLAT